MKRKTRCLRCGGAAFGAALAAWVAAAPARAVDIVRVADGGAVSQPVKAISGGKIFFANNTFLPLSRATLIEFDRFPVAAGASGIVLADGTRLSGVVRSMRKAVVFRSAALGELTLTPDQVAVVYYEPAAPARASAVATNTPCVGTRKGETLGGKVLWADAASVGLMTADGVTKLAADTVSFVRLGPAAAPTVMTLRNGDVVNKIEGFDGSTVRVKVGDNVVSLPLGAVQTFKPTSSAPTAAAEQAK